MGAIQVISFASKGRLAQQQFRRLNGVGHSSMEGFTNVISIHSVKEVDWSEAEKEVATIDLRRRSIMFDDEGSIRSIIYDNEMPREEQTRMPKSPSENTETAEDEEPCENTETAADCQGLVDTMPLHPQVLQPEPPPGNPPVNHKVRQQQIAPAEAPAEDQSSSALEDEIPGVIPMERDS